MSISPTTISRSSVLSGLNSNTSYCTTCGRASAATSGIFGSYGGRVGSDSYVCETCGKTLTSQQNSTGKSTSSFYSAPGVTSSGYCSSCNSSVSSSTWAGSVAKTPSSSASASKTTGTVYAGPGWTK
jgi:DNA-directed RNA polymerase subunit RPC12/RpoP